MPAKRAEVLFVDYIATHLNEHGRAGIIVPEGIIFQSQNAYKQLRRLLVEESLVAVISLPGGVFNPYSGVKTSVLILDKILAPKANHVAFFKVENDGFELGAQRRQIDLDDLPDVTHEINEYIRRLKAGESLNDFAPQMGLLVKKDLIADSGDYSLSGERYQVGRSNSLTWQMVSLDSCIDVLDKFRRPITKSDRVSGPYPYYGATGVLDYVDGYIFDEPLVLVGEDGAKWGPCEQSAYAISGKTWVNNHAHVLRPDRDKVLDEYLIAVLNHSDLAKFVTGVTVPKLNQQKLREIEIPLPPLEVQRELVAELEGYQRVIDGARMVVDNWRPQIRVDPEWPLVRLGECCRSILGGGTPSTSREEYWKGNIPWITSADISNIKTAVPRKFITQNAVDESATNLIPQGNIIVVTRVGLGKVLQNSFDVCISQDSQGLIIEDGIDAGYLAWVLREKVQDFKRVSQGSTIQGVTKKQLAELQIPLPSLEVQRATANRINSHQKAIDEASWLAKEMEQCIQETLARVWEVKVSSGRHRNRLNSGSVLPL